MTNDAEPNPPQSEAGIASAEEGLVILDGPDGIALTLTADAAARTGQNLISAAEIAERQLADMAGGEEGPK